MLATNPVKAEGFTFGYLDTGDAAMYKLSLPAGQYTFHVYADAGDPDAGIGDMDLNPISNDDDAGSSMFQADLNGGTYLLGLEMHRCNKIFSACEVYIDIFRNGVAFTDTHIAIVEQYTGNSASGSAPSSPAPEYGCAITAGVQVCGYN